MKRMMALVLMFAAVACDRQEPGPAPDAPKPQVSEALPANLLLASAPGGARDVKSVRAEAKEGDEVVFRATIGGRKDPVAENRAILTVIDPAIQTCDKREKDSCATPWDACCIPKDTIAANSLSVQVVGGDGKPLKTGLNGVGGIAPLKHVVVVGKYRPSADGNAGVVDATGVYVEN